MKLRLGLMVLVLAITAPATAATRALFVGINDYRYSRQSGGAQGNPALSNLRGAVPDVQLLKTVLRDRYQLAVDPLLMDGRLPTACAPIRAASSITLVNGCATRAAILDALRAQIEASRPDDILLFYYSGHGSSRPAASGRQFSGRNSTIVPSDARDPAGATDDIIDEELGDWLKIANAGGVSVVTIFDSCSSGTATRDLDVRPYTTQRLAPPPTATPASRAPPPRLPPARGGAPAYLVHLAAVADTGVAEEVPIITTGPGGATTEIHGVFTRALVLALAARRGASYREISLEAARNIERWGEAQNPLIDSNIVGVRESLQLSATARAGVRAQKAQSEGGLDISFLGLQSEPARQYPARLRDARTLDVAGDVAGFGSLSGLSEGSSFAVYPGAAAAEAEQGAIGVGNAVNVSAYAAQIRLTAPLAAPPGASLAVRELVHNYDGQRLRLGISGGSPAQIAQIERELAALTFVVRDDTNPQFRVTLDGGDARCAAAGADIAAFRRADGSLVSCIGATTDEAFARRLAKTVRAVANYFMLAGLRDPGSASFADIRFNKLSGCEPGEELCDFDRNGAVVVGQVNDAFKVNVKNRSDRVMYVYGLYLSERDFRVEPLNAVANSTENMLFPSGQGIDNVDIFDGAFRNRGKGKILVLMTEQPLNIAALKQEPVRDIGTGYNALEQLLLYAGAGQRGDGVVRTGAWGAVLTDFVVQ